MRGKFGLDVEISSSVKEVVLVLYGASIIVLCGVTLIVCVRKNMVGIKK